MKVHEKSEKAQESEKGSESAESNIWTRRQRKVGRPESKKQSKPGPVEENVVVWDEYNEEGSQE